MSAKSRMIHNSLILDILCVNYPESIVRASSSQLYTFRIICAPKHPEKFKQKRRPEDRLEKPNDRVRFYTEKDDPQPQVLFTAAFSNLKPAASSVST